MVEIVGMRGASGYGDAITGKQYRIIDGKWVELGPDTEEMRLWRIAEANKRRDLEQIEEDLASAERRAKWSASPIRRQRASADVEQLRLEKDRVSGVVSVSPLSYSVVGEAVEEPYTGIVAVAPRSPYETYEPVKESTPMEAQSDNAWLLVVLFLLIIMSGAR